MRAALVVAVLAGPVAAQDAPIFDPTATQACLDSGSDPQTCPGRSASLCMEGGAGSTTIGMAYCLGAERDWWDTELNAAYGDLMARAEAADADLVPLSAPQAPALRDMQRAWIAFRDAACAYEAIRWTGGTGASGAAAQCALTLTARQTFWLRDYLVEGR